MRTGSKPSYLHAAGRIRSLENSLLTQERLRRILESASISEALRILSECNIDTQNYDFPSYSSSAALYNLSELLNNARARLYDFAANISESSELIDFFRTKIDCHNIKSIIKESKSARRAILLPGGIYSTEELKEFLLSNGNGLSKPWLVAFETARDVLTTTGDAQQSDFVLDKAQLTVAKSYAIDSGSRFLLSYSELLADLANLKSAVRLLRIKDGAHLASLVLTDTGSIPATTVLSAINVDNLSALYTGTKYENALKASTKSTLTTFELELSKLRIDFFDDVKYIAFGPEILISFIVRREEEYSQIRTAIAGKLTGTPIKTIGERLGLS